MKNIFFRTKCLKQDEKKLGYLSKLYLSLHFSLLKVVTYSLSSCVRTASWRSFLAGAIAGPSMLLTGPKTQHTSLAIYIMMRAAVLASRCGIKSKRFGSICKPLTWSHGDIFLMCLASSQILYVCIMH